jgi:cell division protein FtsI/penicillin-binding protein 2
MTDIRQPEDLRQLRPRLQAMVLLVLLAFCALLGRLCQLQVLEGEHYVRKAERNFIDTIEVPAPRGRIFDVQGRLLASNRPAYTLYVTPRPRLVLEDDPGRQSGTRVPLTDEQIDALADLLEFVDKDDPPGVRGKDQRPPGHRRRLLPAARAQQPQLGRVSRGSRPARARSATGSRSARAPAATTPPAS